MSHSIGVVGLGYVGLPLVHAFSEKFDVIGYDINENRVAELNTGYDRTHELNSVELDDYFNNGGEFTSKCERLYSCNIYIITVPTPIDESKNPDFLPLLSATESIARLISIGDIVIYESTVYPGATEEMCVPLLEKISGLKFNRDFFCGYSPERINPGDKTHRIKNIKKITSGSNEATAKVVDQLYSQIIDAGTHLAPSLKIAEAAKVIENAQRDINIAFVNELAIIFQKMNLNTKDVLAAAGTKWNFLNFKPGLVGGHCIGVDPYYLAHKAQQLGHYPEIILSGRRINDWMGVFIASQVIKLMALKTLKIKGSNILVLGITFKENCSDTRNSKVFDIIDELKTFGAEITICDPWANIDEVKFHHDIEFVPFNELKFDGYQAVILAVAHDQFLDLDIKLNKNCVIYDVKGVLTEADGSL